MEEVSKISSYCYTFSNKRLEREYYLPQSVKPGERFQSSSGKEIFL